MTTLKESPRHSAEPKPSIVVVTGPTASGKTRLALHWMERLTADGFRPEMVNADSVQLFQEFDVGSAKPSPEELQRFPSHLFSVYRPNERVDVALFQDDADSIISQIHGRGAVPVIVGGTGLYIQVLLNGIFRYSFSADRGPSESVELLDGSRPASAAGLRPDTHEIERRNRYYQELVTCDPYTAEVLAPSDVVRVVRALQVFRETGDSLRKLQEQHAYADRKYRALVLTAEPDREWLYPTIDRRVDHMFNSGLLEEIKGIVSRHGTDIHPLGALGYRHGLQYLQGSVSLERAREVAKRDTRRYAKRQLTWWRNQPTKLRWVKRNIFDRAQTRTQSSEGGVEADQVSQIKPRQAAVVEDEAYGMIREFLDRAGEYSNDEIYYTPLLLDFSVKS